MNKLNSFISKRIELFFKQTKKQKKCERVWDIYFWPACKVAKLKQGDVTLSISLFMFHLISVSPHFIDHVSFWFPSIHIPSHSFHVPQSISFIFTLFDCIHITWPFKLIISFTFQPILSLEINNLLVPLDKYLILDRYSLLEADLRWFYYSLSLYIKQEIQQWLHRKTREQGELQHRLHCSWFDWLLWRWLKRDQNAGGK